MTDDVLHHDDSSHYEVSLTAGQAFMAFILLLLSLAASFAFGLLIGKGQADDRLLVRKDPPAINEASAAPARKKASPLPELGVSADDFQPATPAKSREAKRKAAEAEESSVAPMITDGAPSTEAPPPAAPSTPKAAVPAARREAIASPVVAPLPAVAAGKPVASGPAYAQILSTSDQKTADALAAKLIDGGFNSAYVERSVTDKGTVFRVRVKFPSEAEAHLNEGKLRAFSKEVWIVK